MPIHHNRKGDRVRIYNGTDANGKPVFEGFATIVKPGCTDNHYTVKFDGDRKHYQRFVNTDGSEKIN